MRGYADTSKDEADTTKTFDKSGVWLQVMASHSQHQSGSTTLDRNITLAGIAARIDIMGVYIDARPDAKNRFANAFQTEMLAGLRPDMAEKPLAQCLLIWA